jgi:hypothetical protein
MHTYVAIGRRFRRLPPRISQSLKAVASHHIRERCDEQLRIGGAISSTTSNDQAKLGDRPRSTRDSSSNKLLGRQRLPA